MHRPLPWIFTAATALAILSVIAVVTVAAHDHAASTARINPTPPRVIRQQTGSTSSISPATDRALLTVIESFAIGYGRYLDGGTATVLSSSGTVTATAQATTGGRIPAAFRDGQLHLTQLSSLQSTCCSASVTVVLANREQSYPFTEQLLNEGGHWLVDQITPSDLAMDRDLTAPSNVSDPAGGQSSARSFAVAYVDYRDGTSSTPPAMTSPAAQQLEQSTDSLAGQHLPKAAARLMTIAFGPPSGDGFAATATLRDGTATQSFSFLMVKTRSSWKCGQFL
jgi:hypothetical protein